MQMFDIFAWRMTEMTDRLMKELAANFLSTD